MHRTILLLALPLAQAEWGRNDASKWKGTAPPLDTSARPPAYNPDAFDVYDTPLPSAPAYDGPEDDWGVDYKPLPPPPTRRRQRDTGRSRATASSQKRSRDSYAGDAYGEEADLVDEYVRTAKGRALVSAGAAGVGAALGAGISESTRPWYHTVIYAQLVDQLHVPAAATDQHAASSSQLYYCTAASIVDSL
eukprot:3612-Heterococcus_DN1.PRE.2